MNLRTLRTSWIIVVALMGVFARPSDCSATGVPIDGFLPFVGITLTNEFDNSGLVFTPVARTSPAANANYLGYGSPVAPVAEIALLDTGAAVSLLTSASDEAFNIDGPYPNRPSGGFRGSLTIGIGGAAGVVEVPVNDPLGLYVAGLQARTNTGGALTLETTALNGQTNTSVATLPSESTLPNILGLPFASQYATRIRNSLPQVFELDGETVRTPAVDFQPLGSGGLGITHKAQLYLQYVPGGISAPAYIFDITSVLGGGTLWDNPQAPTIVQGGHFINATVLNNDDSLSSRFFLDTGASVTVLSTFKALELGFDVTLDEPEFTISITGSGGSVDDVPGFFVDQLTIPALGGNLVVNNLPVIVLDITDVSNPGNIVDGIIGTNVFHGRDIVIDPNPSVGAGGNSPGLYFSNPVTTESNWISTTPTQSWSTATNWSANALPGYLSVANLRSVSGGGQESRIVSGTHAEAFEVNVSSAVSGEQMTLAIASGAKLTTFTGTNVEEGGQLLLENGTLDTQYVDLRGGGTLAGTGIIRTGSGSIPGQVENVGGTLSPGFGTGSTTFGQLEIEGRYASNSTATLAIDLGGLTAGSLYDQLVVDGGAAMRGALQVKLASGYEPLIGSSFEIVTATENIGGEFDLLNLPTSYRWQVDYNEFNLTLSVIGIGGDYNSDGRVDSADYSVWRDSLGSTHLAADGDNSGIVDAGDYAIWRSNFGRVAASGSLANSQGQVPEPATLVLFAAGFVLIAAAKRALRQS